MKRLSAPLANSLPLRVLPLQEGELQAVFNSLPTGEGWGGAVSLLGRAGVGLFFILTNNMKYK